MQDISCIWKVNLVKNISMKDIAELSGVSTATVSRIINNNGRFSEETRIKVEETMERLGYIPNAVAKSLRTMKTLSIGVIIPDITREFFSKVVLGIESYCFPRGYSVYICNTSENKEKENMYVADLISKGVDGLIYLTGTESKNTPFGERQIPTVYIDRLPKQKHIPLVESDNYTGGYIATEELLRSGCENILLLRDKQDLSTMKYRTTGYLHALKKYKKPLDLHMIVKTQDNYDCAKEKLTQIIESGLRFDGVFAATDVMALGVLNALKEYKIEVPQQIKIVGFDNHSITEFTSPTITTISQNKLSMGEIAAEILLDKINDPSKEHENVCVPVELIRRQSTSIS